jgi:hypothetical protein
MGPPQSRLYDTTMPQFPSVRRTPRSAPQVSPLCTNSAKLNPKSDPATAAGPNAPPMQESLTQVGAADESKIAGACSSSR